MNMNMDMRLKVENVLQGTETKNQKKTKNGGFLKEEGDELRKPNGRWKSYFFF